MIKKVTATWAKHYYGYELLKDLLLNFLIQTIHSGINSNIITGIIEQDGHKNYYCGDIILTYTHFNDMGYKIGDTIKITKVAKNTNEKTMHLYLKSALQSEKI